MSKSIGIDLGTTNSAAAVKKIQTESLKNEEGDYITPSCATLQKSDSLKFTVGKNSLEWLKQDPSHTVVMVKRLMGRNFQDKEVQAILSNHGVHYQIREHSKGSEYSLAIVLGDMEFTPEEISAEILKKIKTDAEKVLRDQVEYAVITVPAYFNDKQKHATRTAATLAGLKVRRLLPEPTAAAISFGVDNIRADEAKTILVFDFGGGTLDLSVLTISGGQFIETGKGGDMWLGGGDIDRMVIDYVLQETVRENQIENMTELLAAQTEKNRNRFWGELREKAEQAKIFLSTGQEADIEISGILKDSAGRNLDVEVTLTRDQFEGIIEPVLTAIIDITRKLLRDINFTNDLIEQVLLVGGSSLITAVISALEKEFGREKVITHARPMLAVAEGAAILSHRLSAAYECPQCGKEVPQSEAACPHCYFDMEKHFIDQGLLNIVHTTAHDYYIRLENNENYLLVEKNTPLPCQETRIFNLIHPEQKLVHMKFINIVNENEESIGELWLGIDDKERDDSETLSEEPLQVELTVEIDESNILQITASIKAMPQIKVSRTLSRGKADEKLFLNLEEIINEANQKQYNHFVMGDLTYNALSIIKNITQVVDVDTGEVNEDIYQRVMLKTGKARAMAAEDCAPRSTIYYAQKALDDFGPAISPKTQNKIIKSINDIESMEETGSYTEHITAYNRLKEVLDAKELYMVTLLMRITKAGEYCRGRDLTQASRFYQAVNNILQAIKNKDDKKVNDILDKIMPEVTNMLMVHDEKTEKIHKNLTK